MTTGKLTIRALPSSLARIVEALELRQPTVVTKALLSQLAAAADSNLTVEAIAERLVRRGWLMPLRTQGAWEFAPASRAGRYRAGDPWVELRALLAHKPDAPVAIACESAVWELGYSSHQPTVPVLAHRPGWRPPPALSARAVSFAWRLPTDVSRGLPLWQPATVIVAAADRPAAQGDWGNADDWLPETFRATTPDDVLEEAADRGNATVARLGHLAEWSGRHDIADKIETLLAQPMTVSFLGPRDGRRRWVKRWRLYDALLPPR